MHQLLEKAGIEVTKENKKEVDRLIHRIVEVDYKNCPITWKEVKKRMAEDEAGLVSRLKEQWKEQKT